MASTGPLTCVYMWLDEDLEARVRAVGPIHSLGPWADRASKLALLSDAEGLLEMGASTIVDGELFDAAPHLKVVSTMSVGYDHIDVGEATRRGILVCHTPGVLNEAVVDLTMVMIVELARRLGENGAFVKAGAWAQRETPPPLGMDVRGKTLGVVGYGRIGRELADRMRLLGMNVVWYDPMPQSVPGVFKDDFRTLDVLLAESDFVSLHASWLPGAPPVIGAAELAQMKPSAYLVNTGRGGLVDQAALTGALQSGVIAGAGLDVLVKEPPDPDDPIPQLPNVICYPHIGSATVETRYAMRALSVDNLVAALTGKVPPAPLNPEVLDSWASGAHS
jgi:glyoxylate reductase